MIRGDPEDEASGCHNWGRPLQEFGDTDNRLRLSDSVPPSQRHCKRPNPASCCIPRSIQAVHAEKPGLLFRDRPRDSQSEVVVPEVRGVPEPVGRTDIARLSVPRSSPNGTPIAIALLPSASIRRCTFVVPVPAVLNPFPDIPGHVVQAQFVG